MTAAVLKERGLGLKDKGLRGVGGWSTIASKCRWPHSRGQWFRVTSTRPNLQCSRPQFNPIHV